MAMILVTHDLGVVAGRADEIAVMYAGRIVEKAPTRALFRDMRMPYTEALVNSIPKIDASEPHQARGDPGPSAGPGDPSGRLQVRAALQVRPSEMPQEEPPLLEAATPGHLYRCWFPVGTAEVTVDLARNGQPSTATRFRRRSSSGRHRHGSPPSRRRERLAGRGVGAGVPRGAQGPEGPRGVGNQHRRARRRDAGPRRRIGVRQDDDRPRDPADAAARLGTACCSTAQDLTALHGEKLRKLRPRLQMIFQDPISSLNPRRTVARHHRRAAQHLGDR